MTQEGIVTRLLARDMAEVAVTRMTACSGNCGSCESCMLQSEVKATAHNLVSAQPGQRVLIESRTSAVFGAIFLVYVMPLVFFLLGYAAAWTFGASEGICILCSFLGLALGAFLLVLTQRGKKKNSIRYDIIKLLE